MLKLINIYKSYEKNNVLENISLEIKKGTLFGLIGPNGAGKTTLISLILNKLEFKGNILIKGVPNYEYLKKNRNKIVYLPENPFLYDFLTGIEFIRFILEMQKIPYKNVAENVRLLLYLFELDYFKNQLIHNYSLGMKRKIALISVLIQSPEILILDEPVAGVDAKGIIILKRLLKSISQKGTTVIFTTHILDLITNLCKCIAILNNKKVTFYDNISKMGKDEIEKIYLNLIGGEIDTSINKFTKSIKRLVN